MTKNLASKSGIFNPRALVALTFCLAGVGLAMISFATTMPATWAIIGSPNTNSGNSASGQLDNDNLHSVTCASASECWAVGYFRATNGNGDATGIPQTLIEQWNGNSWAIVPSPNKLTSDNSPTYNSLYGVTCTSASECWAAGYSAGSVVPWQTLVEHWDGTQWSIVSSPNGDNGSLAGNFLYAVSCASASECWAVGNTVDTSSGSSITQTLIELWDGTQWSVVASPNPGATNNFLTGVTCASALECWAVGYHQGQTLIEQWDGTQWSIVASPNTSASDFLNGVTCASASDCWAVGYDSDFGAFTVLTLIEHWDGAAWSIVTSPNTGAYDQLTGVTCASASDCWAVGYDGQGSGDNPGGHTLIEQWNGTSWSIVSSPNFSGALNDLYSVACASASECWAVGDYHTSWDQTLIETLTTSPVTITTSASPTAGGTTSGGSAYVSGTSVTVNATPNTNSGYVFTNWTQGGSVVSTSPSYTFIATSNRTLVAHFIQTYTISSSASPTAGGTTSGGGTYNKGSSVTVTATSNSGYTFTNWTQGSSIVSHLASYTFTASANRALVANFTTNPVTLTTSSSPSNGGTTSGDGTYASGANVTVKATPSIGYTFTNWTQNGNIVSHSASYTFKLTSNSTLVANFTNNPVTVSTTSLPTAGGTVSGGGTYASGASVTVSATAKSGYVFTNWTESGSVVSTSASYTFTATSNRTLVANFTQTYKITVSASPSADGTVTGGGTYTSGASVTVTATAKTGHTFTNWTQNGSVVSTSASYTFTATANRALVANFM